MIFEVLNRVQDDSGFLFSISFLSHPDESQDLLLRALVREVLNQVQDDEIVGGGQVYSNTAQTGQ